MKTTKIIYWISTVLLIVIMLFTVVQTFTHPDSREAFAKQIQFPGYMFQALAIGKALGVIVILIPGYPKVKEWVYAGFTFDLLGAIVLFAGSPLNLPASQWAPMLIGGLVLLAASYLTYHKILKAKPSNS